MKDGSYKDWEEQYKQGVKKALSDAKGRYLRWLESLTPEERSDWLGLQDRAREYGRKYGRPVFIVNRALRGKKR